MSVVEVEDLRRDFVVRRPAGRLRRTSDVVRRRRRGHVHRRPGECVGYIGANGAGKSTTIKMLTGILVPTCGHGPGLRPRAGARSGGSWPAGSASCSASAASCGGTCRCASRSGCSAAIHRLPAGRARRRLDRVRRAAGDGAVPGHPGPAALARAADARRGDRGAAALPRAAGAGRADDRAGPGEQGAAARASWSRERAERGTTRAAHHPRPARHRAALRPDPGGRPRPGRLRRHPARAGRPGRRRAGARRRPGRARAAADRRTRHRPCGRSRPTGCASTSRSAPRRRPRPPWSPPSPPGSSCATSPSPSPTSRTSSPPLPPRGRGPTSTVDR